MEGTNASTAFQNDFWLALIASKLSQIDFGIVSEEVEEFSGTLDIEFDKEVGVVVVVNEREGLVIKVKD